MKKHKLYFENLNTLSRVADIKKLFSAFGKVLGMNLHKDPILFRSTGRGYIEMENIHGASKCIEKLHGSAFMGNIISVSWAAKNFAKV